MLKEVSMNTLTRIGIALCFVFGLLANFANAGQPKKSDLEARIASLEEAQRKRDSFPVLPISPQSITTAGCVVGTVAICHRRDGTVVPICAGDISPCWEEDPTSEFCPEVCEAEGNIVVVDYAYDPCDNDPRAFFCMPPEQYDPPNCDAFYVPHYNSLNGGWGCDLSIKTQHISKSMFEALLFESTRTNYLNNEIVK
jgi:hypothetical protein